MMAITTQHEDGLPVQRNSKPHFFHLILTVLLGCGCYHYFHYTDEKPRLQAVSCFPRVIQMLNAKLGSECQQLDSKAPAWRPAVPSLDLSGLGKDVLPRRPEHTRPCGGCDTLKDHLANFALSGFSLNHLWIWLSMQPTHRERRP